MIDSILDFAEKEIGYGNSDAISRQGLSQRIDLYIRNNFNEGSLGACITYAKVYIGKGNADAGKLDELKERIAALQSTAATEKAAEGPKPRKRKPARSKSIEAVVEGE